MPTGILELIAFGYLINVSVYLGIAVLSIPLSIISIMMNPSNILKLTLLEARVTELKLLRELCKVNKVNPFISTDMSIFFPYAFILKAIGFLYGTAKDGFFDFMNDELEKKTLILENRLKDKGIM